MCNFIPCYPTFYFVLCSLLYAYKTITCMSVSMFAEYDYPPSCMVKPMAGESDEEISVRSLLPISPQIIPWENRIQIKGQILNLCKSLVLQLKSMEL